MQPSTQSGLSRLGLIIAIGVLIGAVGLIYLFSQIQISSQSEVGSDNIIEADQPHPTRMVRLYFSDGYRGTLVPETREIPLDDEEFTEQVKAVVRALVQGPIADTLGATLPPTTVVKSVFLDEHHRLYLEFEEPFLTDFAPSGTSELLGLQSLIRTLADAFRTVNSLQLLVNGSPIETISGHIDFRSDSFYLVDWQD